MNGTEKKAMQHIGSVIATKRKAMALTQLQLATMCNLQFSQIKAVENGDRSYTIPTLLNICETLGIYSLNLKFYHNE